MKCPNLVEVLSVCYISWSPGLPLVLGVGLGMRPGSGPGSGSGPGLGPVLTLLAVVFSAHCVLRQDPLEQLGWSSLEVLNEFPLVRASSGDP